MRNLITSSEVRSLNVNDSLVTLLRIFFKLYTGMKRFVKPIHKERFERDIENHITNKINTK